MTEVTGQGRGAAVDSQRVVVGVDGSADGLRAAAFAARMALRTGGSLHVLYVLDDSELTGDWVPTADPSELLKRGWRFVEQAIAAAVGVWLPKELIRGDVQLGHVSVILNRVAEGAALVVVGRRSHLGTDRPYVGSGAVAVASRTECPAVVISNSSNPDETGGRNHIGVAVDASSSANAALGWAYAEAARRGTRLTVAHVVKSEHAALMGPGHSDAARSGMAAILEPLHERYPEVPVSIRAVVGHPLDVLVGLSSECDLLVIGQPRPRMNAVHLSGPVRAIMAHADCPVVVVKG